MLCPSCHTANRENAKFCKGCGMSFTTETVAAPVDTQAPPQTTVADQSGTQGSSSPSVGATPAAAGDQANVPAAEPSTTSTAQEVPPQQEPVPPAEQETAYTHSEEDPSLAPTQILTPDKMLAYQSRRWQQETERETRQSALQTANTTPQDKSDIADAPTMFIRPSDGVFDATVPVVPAPSVQPDIADMPTMLIPPVEPVQIPPPPPDTASSPTSVAANIPAQDETVIPQAASSETATQPPQATETSGTTTETAEAATTEAVPSKTKEEEAMEHVTPSTDEQLNQDQQEQQAQPEPAGDFPVLATGTLVGNRYEITQVIAEDASEHVYQVTDRQGYQHCWNCGSEENAEGDEFCITCGAELLNMAYVMHEYPASESSSESHVIQGTILNTFVDRGQTYVIEQPQATQSAFPNGVHLLAATDSDSGDVRRSEPNEDSTLVLQLQRVHESISSPVGIYLVADGMGGHENGQLASRTAIGTIAERMVRELVLPPLSAEKASEEPKAMDEDSLVTLLQGAVEDANSAISQINQRNKTDMGCTLTGFMITGDLAYILNVGDSRTYLLRDGKLYQLTNDHSLVGQMVAGGLIEPDEIYTHPQRSQIYRSLGDKQNVQIDIFKQQIHPGDILLSCSDGLWEMVRNPQIADILNNAADPQTACTQLIEAANANGGDDNISTVVVFVR